MKNLVIQLQTCLASQSEKQETSIFIENKQIKDPELESYSTPQPSTI